MNTTKKFWLIVFVLITTTTAFAQSRIGGKVVDVIDGKTVVIEMQNRSRLTAELQYIEVPEVGQPFNEIVKEHLSALVLNKSVELRTRGFRQTVTVGQLFLKSVDISQQMIRDGAAWYAVPQKSGQDAEESAIYQNLEAQAKNEKLGIWSVENLKPSWQIRAEAEENRQRLEKTAREKAIEQTLAAQNQQPKPPIKPKVTAAVPIPATAAYPSNFSLPVDTKITGGLMVGYDSSNQLTVTATPLMNIDVADKNGEQAVSVQVARFYSDGSGSRVKKTLYLVNISSESRDFKFLEHNQLIVTVDNQKIIIGKARRVAGQNGSGIKETLLYEIKKDVLTKIVNGKNLEIKVGNYSRKLDSGVQMLLNNLLQFPL